MSITFNPMAQTNALGSFNVTADGLIQGMAMADPASRFALNMGVVGSGETNPMWGGLGISEAIPGTAGTTAVQLGSLITRATVIGNSGVAGQLTGFTVFDQGHSMVNWPQSPVPTASPGMSIPYYRLGSGARIALPCSSTLSAAMLSNPINNPVSWDFVAQELVPYGAAWTAVSITGATWASTAGGETTFTVGTDLTTKLAAGSIIDVSGVVNTGGASTGAYNGNFVVVSVTSTTIVVYQAASGSPGTYASGGTVAAGGGALPVKVLSLSSGNSMTVTYSGGNATWNRSGNAALVLLTPFGV